jgi:hypothetical protein
MTPLLAVSIVTVVFTGICILGTLLPIAIVAFAIVWVVKQLRK